MYEDNVVAYENDVYVVKVGIFPGEELDSYLVINKEFGVVEYVHSVLHYARAWADSYASVLEGTKPGVLEVEELPDLEAQ